MPSVRSLVLISVLIAVVSLVAACISLVQTPDSGGLGHDTYGTKGYGFRVLYDVLTELTVAVDRRVAPPTPAESVGTIVFLQPDDTITRTEPFYLRRLIPWVEQGGRIVVALSHTREFDGSERFTSDRMNVIPLPSILESFGIEDVETEWIYASPESRDFHRETGDEESLLTLNKDLVDAFTKSTAPAQVVEVQTVGTSAVLPVKTLSLPGDAVQVLTFKKSKPVGMVQYRSADSSEHVLVAEFGRGSGSIVVVSDHALFRNRYLPQADNSLLAVELIAASQKLVSFDEFYHGLGVRGNPLFPLTRPGYAALALGLLMFASILIWREAVLLGPPLPDSNTQRRDLGEYLTAMGRFFSQGRTSYRFLVEQVRGGVLREMCRQLALAREMSDVETVARALSRRSPKAGAHFRTTLAEIDAKLNSGVEWQERQTLDALGRLTDCLSTNT